MHMVYSQFWCEVLIAHLVYVYLCQILGLIPSNALGSSQMIRRGDLIRMKKHVCLGVMYSKQQS